MDYYEYWGERISKNTLAELRGSSSAGEDTNFSVQIELKVRREAVALFFHPVQHPTHFNPKPFQSPNPSSPLLYPHLFSMCFG